MSIEQPKNPLHGVKLARIVEELVDHFGWPALASRININCFSNDPSVKSSLKFLRREQWARDKVEALWVKTFAGKPARPATRSTSNFPKLPKKPS